MFPNQSNFTTQQTQTSPPNPAHLRTHLHHLTTRPRGVISHLDSQSSPENSIPKIMNSPYENVTLHKNTLPFLPFTQKTTC